MDFDPGKRPGVASGQAWTGILPKRLRDRNEWRGPDFGPGLPTSWTRLVERNPEAMSPDPLPGYVLLDTPGKVLHVQAARLEFRNEPPA